jgi:hypothetical protein
MKYLSFKIMVSNTTFSLIKKDMNKTGELFVGEPGRGGRRKREWGMEYDQSTLCTYEKDLCIK